MAGGAPWTEEEEEVLAQLRASGLTVSEVHERFDEQWPGRRTFEAVHSAVHKRPRIRKRVDELKAGGTTEKIARHLSGEAQPDVYDELPTLHRETEWDPVPPEQRWADAEARTERLRSYHQSRHHARLDFVTGRPVAFAVISDQHIATGAPVALKRMREDAELVRDTPGLFALLGGDGVDNHIKHRSAMVASGSKPGEEWQLYDHYLGIFGTSLQAMISGNHDDWSKDMSDIDVVGRLAKRRRVFYAPDYVILSVMLRPAPDEPGPTYKIALRHQYGRFGSAFNKGHKVKRWWEMGDEDFDIGVVCHEHEPHLEPFWKHGVMRYAARPGSYQLTSGYARRGGYPHSTPTCPTFVLLPTRRRIIGFVDVREAASYLTWLRSGWPDTGTVFDAA